MKRAKPSHGNEVLNMLRSKRRRMQLSLIDLGKLIGHDPSGISRWEFGKGSPLLEDAAEWAHVLGFDIYFVEREE